MNLTFLTASRLRIILFVTMGLTLLLSIGIFYLAYGRLSKSASETGEQVANARDSQHTIQRLQALEKDLKSKQEVIDRTSRVVADSQNYTYQDRLINDITVYAARAHLSINNISFAAGQAGAGAAAPAGGTAAPAATSSLKTATVDITLQNPVSYTDYLNFLHYIEQNLTKLKISRVSLSKSGEGEVTTDALHLEVYVR